MKNLTKIFMAVAVAMLSFACATDLTDDLGVKLGGEGQTTITISLEESRTQLGEKNADGLYPLYWSEGDAISVNGVASVAQISPENPAHATFAVAEADKYEVAYPAAPAGQVLFAEKQNHVVAGNTFESGVSTMYGTGVAGEAIELHNLTGVLKIGVTGSAVLSKIQISTIDRAPIAGAFDINFATGKLTATEASKSVIEYSFGEAGLQLTADAQWVHIAVPAGQYDELYVTLYDNAEGVMYAKVKAGESKPLTAGSVREFNTPIAYAANAQLFVIDSPERLAEFKIKIESEAGLTMDAILTEDIDMTGYSWISIAGSKYTNTIYGNGYAIKGLTAPLFHTTSASFKGLHLVDVDMVSNITAKADRLYGALVGLLKPATGVTELSVENCSVSGKIKLHNPNYAIRDNIFLGGLIGASYGAVIDSCESSVTITNDQYNDGSVTIKSFGLGGVVGIATSSSEIYSSISNTKFAGEIDLNIKEQIGTTANVGGVVGYIQGSYNLVSNVSNCESSGTIKFQTTASATNVIVGGIAGTASEAASKATSVLNMSNCKSSGAVEVSGTITTANVGGVAGIAAVKTATVQMTNCENSAAVAIGGTITTPCVGGITGYAIGNADSAFTGLTNSGSVTVKSGAVMPSTSAISGIAGISKSCHMDTVVNNGAIVVEEGAKIVTCYIGGIIGIGTKDGAVTTVQNLTNNGPITYNGEAVDATTATQLRVGGVIAYTQSAILNATNTGDITIAGSLNPNTATPETFTEAKGDCYAGVVGYKTLTSTNKVTNTGNITVTATMNSLAGEGKKAQVNIAGLVGYTSNNINAANETEYKSVSSGDITVSGNTTNCTLCIGGSIAHPYTNGQNNETCSSDIKVRGTHTGDLYVGGVVSATICSCDNMTFTGSIDIAGTIGGKTVVGGIVGHTTLPITGSKAYCDIAATENAKVGFIAGVERTDTVIASNCQVGGTLASVVVTPGTPEHEDPNSGVIVPGTPDTYETVSSNPIDATNWFKHIYSAEVAEEVATTDGCSLIESAPAI